MIKKLSKADTEEIAEEIGHIPDRDQEFTLNQSAAASGPYADQSVGGEAEYAMRGTQDVDEGEWGRVSDPAYEREGAAKAQRALMGDESVVPKISPIGRSGTDGMEDLTRQELSDRAKALAIPGWMRMNRVQLIDAMRTAISPHH